MLKASFDIIPDTSATDRPHDMLLLEISENIFGYVLYNKEKKQFFGLRQYNLEYSNEKNPSQLVNDIIDSEPILQGGTQENMIIYNFPESSIVPQQYFDNASGKSFIEFNYGSVKSGLVAKEK